MRYLLAVLTMAGLVVSFLALRVHYSNSDNEICSINEKWDCGIVNHSQFAEIAHVPVAALGMAGYVLMGALALTGRRRLLLEAALPALVFSLCLTWIEAKVLMVYCIYCVISLGLVSLITLLSAGWTVAGLVRKQPS